MRTLIKGLATLAVFCLLAACAAMRPAADHHLAFVTNEGSANLMVVDLVTEKVVKTLATGKKPHALVFTPAGKGYVNNRGEHSLTVIDGRDPAVLGTIPLPATSMQLALSPDGRTLAVSYRDALAVSLIDTAADTVRATVTIGPDRPGKKPVRIKHPFWSADGRFIYAGDNLNHTVVKIDAAAGRVAAVIPLGATVHHFVTAPDGTIYVCEGKDDQGRLNVAVLDAESDRIIATIPIPLSPGEKAFGHHGAFTPDGRFFYHCNEGGRTLAIIDTAVRKVVKTIETANGAGHTYFSRDGKRAFVVGHHDNRVTVVDTATQRITRNITVGRGKKEGHSGYVAEDGDFYMLNAADGAIERIDGRTLTLASRIEVGAKPMIMVVR